MREVYVNHYREWFKAFMFSSEKPVIPVLMGGLRVWSQL